MVDKRVCIAVKEAISDERKAPPMYKEIIELLRSSDELTEGDLHELNNIVSDEESHEKYFIDLASRLGCELSTREKQRTLYADLPLRERLALARKNLERY